MASSLQWDGKAGTHLKQGGPPAALHSDVGLSFPGRVMLRAVAFVADCPPGAGGFSTRTHVRSGNTGNGTAANQRSMKQRQINGKTAPKRLSYRQRVERWVELETSRARAARLPCAEGRHGTQKRSKFVQAGGVVAMARRDLHSAEP